MDQHLHCILLGSLTFVLLCVPVQQRIVPDAIESSTLSLKTCLTRNIKEPSEIIKNDTASLQLKEHCKLEAEAPLLHMKVNNLNNLIHI